MCGTLTPFSPLDTIYGYYHIWLALNNSGIVQETCLVGMGRANLRASGC